MWKLLLKEVVFMVHVNTDELNVLIDEIEYMIP